MPEGADRVAIDAGKCDGCGVCLHSCPTDVLRFDVATQKASVAYPDDCCTCFLCQDDCPQHAIVVSFSGANPRHTSIYDLLGIA
jgi:NAD-dependent dihydropyrimidine dehydrogenase PreA subunit